MIIAVLISCSSNKRSILKTSSIFEYSINISEIQSELSKMKIDTFVLVKIYTWEGEKVSINFIKNGLEFAAFSEVKSNKRIAVYPKKSFVWGYLIPQTKVIEQCLLIPWSTNDTLIDENGMQLIRERPSFNKDPFVEVRVKLGNTDLIKTYFSAGLPTIYKKEEVVWLLIVHAISGSF